MNKVCLPAALALLLLAGLAGCIDYEENIIINRDGSGTIETRYTIEKKYFELLGPMYYQLDEANEGNPSMIDSIKQLFGRQAIEKTLAARGAVVILEGYESSETEENLIYNLKFSFADLNQAAFLISGAAPTQNADTAVTMPPIFSKQPDGAWLYQRPLVNTEQGESESEWTPSEAELAEIEEIYDTTLAVPIDSAFGEYESGGQLEMTEESVASEYEDSTFLQSDSGDLSAKAIDSIEDFDDFAAAMREMNERMARHKIRLSIQFPGTIIESNATQVKGNKAVWEYKLSEIRFQVETLTATIRY